MIGSEVQRALFLALQGIAGGRIYDRPPKRSAFPYLTIGDDQVLDDGNSCGAGWEIFEDVHIWSRPRNGSKREVKELRKTVVQSVLGISSIGGQRLIAVSLDSARTLRDPDGLTEHEILTFRFLTQEDE